MTTPLCQVCGKRTATYVCRPCGRTVCGGCFDPAVWSCFGCHPKTTTYFAGDSGVRQFSLASWLLFLASATIMVGMLLIAYGSLTNSVGGVSGGAVILIGPIPIILGNGPYSLSIIAMAGVLTIFALVFYLLVHTKPRR